MLNVNTAFYFQRNDPTDFKVHPHTHKCYELVYYYSGEGYSRISNKKYEYKANSCILIPPDQPHNDVHRTDCNLVCVGFTLEKNDFSAYCGNFADVQKKISRYLLMIDCEFKEQKTDFMILVNNLLENILLEIKRISRHYPEKSTDHKDTIYQALNYIDEYFLTDISSEQLAAISKYSYDRFRHIFKKVMNISPKQYIINKRLEYSKKLLASTDFSVTEISYQCGFSSTSHFIQVFKQETNITPVKYRKQLSAELIFSPEQTTYKNKTKSKQNLS